MSNVIDRFLRYVKVDTESMPGQDCYPSTAKQLDLLAMLKEELIELGLDEVSMDEKYGYVFATIPSNTDNDNLSTIGFIAHVDTSPAVTGKNVNPRIINNYDGEDIILNEELGVILSPKNHPEMLDYIGQDFIVTDGTTLLGADDKAGVAEIMAMAEYLVDNPDIPHGKIRIGFTPDEEVGGGVDYFDVKAFGADYAYTIDGGELGEIEYENFNAANATLTIIGKSVHPGTAKGNMLNSVLMAYEFNSLLPTFDIPSHTEHYEGFYHLDDLNGNVEKTVVTYIIRDHDAQLFKDRKRYFEQCVSFMNEKYNGEHFILDMKDSYYNMRDRITPHMHLIDNAVLAMEKSNVIPRIMPIRGGTDGSRLSYMGLPCPNLCTGGHNYHGKYEYAVVQSMEKIVEVLVELVQLYSIPSKSNE